ncbi:MAG: hypothetical protein H0T68_04120 [Gemmatimonadales bacterium]|nr:hypothetical protein [Gemmatimonadales bacterium]
MDPIGLLFLGFLWFLFNVLRKSQGQTGPTPPSAPPGTGDATQREGSRLEALFRELERTLGEGAGPSGRPAGAPLPPAEEVENRETLETGVEVVSLEQEVLRPPRPRIDREERAEGIEAARVASAEKRSGALTRADHAAFDARIRQAPADATAVRALTSEQIRRAVVWREILSPPVSLREPER